MGDENLLLVLLVVERKKWKRDCGAELGWNGN
jgi:hypothetical protein